MGATAGASAATITLNTLADSVMVGEQDTAAASAPAAPGDGWFTGPHAGTIRARSTTAPNPEFRTQWNFRFDASALAGVAPGTITSATLSIPQIGRLNTVSGPGNVLNLYANTYDWDDDGSADYPTWNRGRTDQGGDGFTVAASFGGADTHGTALDLSNTNVEGTFVLDTATYPGLLTAVQNWATDPAANEGFLMTYQNAHNIGLAFGTPTLDIEVVPEPATGGLLLLGLALAARRRRA